MKKRPSLSRKQICLYILLLILCTILLLSFFRSKKDEREFTRLTEQLFLSEMPANTLSMHYSLAFPENYGITDYTASLPLYQSRTAGEVPNSQLTRTLYSLQSIRPEKLSPEDAYTYGLLQRKLTNHLALEPFFLYSGPLSSSGGVPSQLPILLSEYTFRTTRDVEDYLSLLAQTGEYFDSLLQWEKDRMDAGFGMSTYAMRCVKEQCDTILSKKALQTGSHFLQTSFEERISRLMNAGLLSEEEAGLYNSRNTELLLTIVQPAYEHLADTLFLWEDESRVPPFPVGLASYPEGQPYYEALLVSQTGSYHTVPQIREMLQQMLQTESASITSILQENPGLYEHLAEKNYTLLPLTTPDEMLQDLQVRMEQDFPAISCAPATVKYVSGDLQKYCAPAFYLTAPLDDCEENTIYINADPDSAETPDYLELYTTLAHEGYPGHLYQTVYHNRACQDRTGLPIRELLWYGGYLEGWALYVEFYGYDYASALLSSEGRSQDALCVQLEKHNRSLMLCLYSQMDLMIHYDNASLEDLKTFLQQYGIENDAAVRNIYCYIAEEPCNYLKYYLGYLEILDLKRTAQTVWGEAYTDLDFHRFFLDAGPSDFQSLSELLKNHTGI